MVRQEGLKCPKQDQSNIKIFYCISMRLTAFSILCLLVLLQNIASEPLSINLKETVHTTISHNQTQSYTLTLPNKIHPQRDLYIRAGPSTPDPLQLPYLLVSADQKYQQKCYNAHSSFSSICRIDSTQLSPGRVFTFEVQCPIKCFISISTYLSSTMTVHLGKQETVVAQKNSDMVSIIKVPIPRQLNYSSLILTAFIKNIEENTENARQGVTMLINYGLTNVSSPTEENFMADSQELFSGGRVAFLGADKVIPGSWIKVYLKIKKGMVVIFSVAQHDGNQQQVQLGRSVFDMVKFTAPKLYRIDTQSVRAQIRNKTIELVFDFYSGSPVVQIGFDPTFNTSVMQVSRSTPSISLEITPQMRADNGFNNSLFIRISSTETAEFYLYSQIINDWVSFMKPYTTYFDSLIQGEVYNYILDQRYVLQQASNQSTIRNYIFRLQSTQGSGKIHIRRCQSLEMGSGRSEQSLQDCLIKSPDVLATYAFVKQQIQTKMVTSGNLINFNLSYDISKCPLIEQKEKQQVRQCIFQIVPQIDLSIKTWSYTIQVERKLHTSYLREGKIAKEYLAKGSYSFFSFALPDYSDVTDIYIFTTTFSGRSVLIVSQQDHYPTVDSKASDIMAESGAKSVIHLKKNIINSLKEIYIGIYGQTFAEVNLGVTVYRKNQGTKKIYLQPSNVLDYRLERHEVQVHFLFTVNQASKVIVSLNELVGLVEMSVVAQNGTLVECGEFNANRGSCEFSAEASHNYMAVVKGRSEQEQHFTVGFVTEDHCKKAMLNSPIFVNLKGYVLQCYVFDVNRAVDLQYINSLTAIETVSKNVGVQLLLNYKPIQIIRDNQHRISISDIIKVCRLGIKTNKKDLAQTCMVGFNFVSYTNSTKTFEFLLQEEDSQMALFDGITKQTTQIDVNIREDRYFYFKVTQNKPIRVFISTPSKAIDFFIAASVIDKKTFTMRVSDQGIYPQFKTRTKRTPQPNYFSSKLGATGTAVFTIDSPTIKKIQGTDDICYLLISVFPDATPAQRLDNSKSNIFYSQFEIEVVQTQTQLTLGQTKSGFVSKKNYDTYIVSAEDALISIRNMDQQSNHLQPCAKLSGGLADGSVALTANVIGGNLEVTKKDKIEYIYVKGTSSKCNYQISYISLDMPLSNAKLSQPYQLYLQAGETRKFIYYHANPQPFKIVKLIGAGKLVASILNLTDPTLKLKDALKIDFKNYPIVDEDQKEHIMDPSDSNFCFRCYYLIVVSTPTTFQGEVIFLRNEDPIPLTPKNILKQSLMPNSWQKYMYYTLTDFNVTFQVITGKVSVTIFHPNGAILQMQKVVSNKQSFKIPCNLTSQTNIYYSSQTQYDILVEVFEQTEFYIRVDKNAITQRIFQGMPATFQLSNTMPLPLEFSNGQINQKQLSLMINIDTPTSSPALQFDVSGQDENGTRIQNTSALLLKTTPTSQGTYILTLTSFRGVYFVSISSHISLNITTILFNKQLTHLKPNYRAFFDKEGVYQLFTNQKNVLVQVFNCQGDFFLLASKDIRDTQKLSNNRSSPITLRRPNYAGHYVLGVEGIFGSYFLRINSKIAQSPIEYQITYSFYSETNPYQLLDAKNYDLEADQSSSGILVKYEQLGLIAGADSQLSLQKVEYVVYASNNKVDLRRYSRCNIGGSVVTKKVVEQKNRVYLDAQLLEQIVSQSQSQGSFFITVQARVFVTPIKNTSENQRPIELRIFYNTLEVAEGQQYKYLFTNSFLILLAWLILPFLVAAIVVFYLLRFCIRRLMSMQGSLVQEVEIVAASNPTVPSSSKLVAGSGPMMTLPDSAKTLTKEYI